MNGQGVVEFGFWQCGQTFQEDFVRFSVFFFDFGQAAVFVGIFEGGLQEVAVFGEGLGEIGKHGRACAVKSAIIANASVLFEQYRDGEMPSENRILSFRRHCC